MGMIKNTEGPQVKTHNVEAAVESVDLGAEIAYECCYEIVVTGGNLANKSQFRKVPNRLSLTIAPKNHSKTVSISKAFDVLREQLGLCVKLGANQA